MQAIAVTTTSRRRRDHSELGVEGGPPEVFFALPFTGHVPQGTVVFHDGFKADGRQTDA